MKTPLLARAFAPLSAGQAPVNCTGKLTEDQLSKLVKGKVAETRILQHINDRGVRFSWNTEINTRLSTAGATPGVLSAVESKAAKPAALTSSGSPDDVLLRADLALWESVDGRKTVAAYEDYLQRLPNGTFAFAACQEIERLKAASEVDAQAIERRRQEKEREDGEAKKREQEALAETRVPPESEIIASVRADHMEGSKQWFGTLYLTASRLVYQGTPTTSSSASLKRNQGLLRHAAQFLFLPPSALRRKLEKPISLSSTRTRHTTWASLLR